MVAALTDIHIAASAQPSTSTPDPALFVISMAILNKLLIALNECSEWGRVAVLNALVRYLVQDEKESDHICERVVPQFQHVNGSVILAAVKVCLVTRVNTSNSPPPGHHDPHRRRQARRPHQAAHAQNGATARNTSVVPPPRFSGSRCEISIFCFRSAPRFLNEMHVFFCKYNDPLYVKIEKLDSMVRLAAERSVDALLSELRECVCM